MNKLVSLTDAARDGVDDDALPALFATETGDFTAGQYAEILSAKATQPATAIGVHVRLPFCPSRCLNCDHHTTVTHNGQIIDDYLAGIEQEIRMVTDRIGRGRPLAQLHLGGGTPNYLSDTQLVRLMDVIEQHFTLDADTETSLEASPKRCSPSQLALLRGLGFDIINFQVRDLDSEVQLAIGRSHSVPMLEDVFANARSEGFGTVGMDLVYGLPNQSVASVRRTVAAMLELGPDRIVCHTFARRPDIFKHQRALDPSSLPSLADKVAMFNVASEALIDSGYEWVGLDCFARDGDALATAKAEGSLHRNWVGYTTRRVSDLFGFGADAVSQLVEANIQNQIHLADWRAALSDGELPVHSGVLVSEVERRHKAALNDLMCNLELADYRDLLGMEGEEGVLGELERKGMVTVSDEKVEVTEYGRFALHQLWGDASPHFRGALAC
jgi:oxygen-independent coproporphyrinogen-3 oxidase